MTVRLQRKGAINVKTWKFAAENQLFKSTVRVKVTGEQQNKLPTIRAGVSHHMNSADTAYLK